jgi:hypothetical protein
VTIRLPLISRTRAVFRLFQNNLQDFLARHARRCPHARPAWPRGWLPSRSREEDIVKTTCRAIANLLPLRRTLGSAVVVLILGSPAFAQMLPPPARVASLAGPRFGLTFLSDGLIKSLEERDVFVGPHISQFGWQFERQFFARGGNMTMVTEWVALLGGLDQGVALPSLSWLVGLRTRDGAEFGIGPNFTPAGSALVLATGMTFRQGALNIPVNVAVVPSKSGTRVSVMTGFSLRRY